MLQTQGQMMINSTLPKKYQVLLAEDDEVNQDIIRAFLADISYVDLTVVSDGRMALEAALVNKYDLMILDQQMPHITGDRMLLHLRAGRTG